MQPLTNPVAKDVKLTFGLVSMVVNVHTAVADIKDAQTHQACNHEHPLTRVRQVTACPTCGNDDKGSFVRVKEISKQLILVHEEWLAQQAAEAAKFKQNMAITWHPADQVAAALIPNGKTYYMSLTPGSHPEAWKAYSLLTTLIENNPNLTFMTKLTFRTALQLFSLSASDGMLILKAMADTELVRERPAVQVTEVSKVNLGIGQQIIEAYLEDFDAVEHGSTGREKLAEQIAATVPMTPGVEGEVVDVTEALELTIKAKKAKAPAKKAAAKKAATPRKSAVRKAS